MKKKTLKIRKKNDKYFSNNETSQGNAGKDGRDAKKIEETEIEGLSGGGAVKVIINGKHVLKKITIDPNIVDKNEVEVLEDLILAAVNDATKKISENMSNQMNSISGGLGLPPGMKLPF